MSVSARILAARGISASRVIRAARAIPALCIFLCKKSETVGFHSKNFYNLVAGLDSSAAAGGLLNTGMRAVAIGCLAGDDIYPAPGRIGAELCQSPDLQVR